MRRRMLKHLHGRGEDSPPCASKSAGRETPPRTWRRRIDVQHDRLAVRNTSTDVEKTSSNASFSFSLKKHLHGRGEDLGHLMKGSVLTETPPRTWRRHCVGFVKSKRLRNTSTDVEKTQSHSWGSPLHRKHLHGRGEDPRKVASALRRSGNTSTDVEKTARFSVMLIQPTLLFVVVVVKGGSLTN